MSLHRIRCGFSTIFFRKENPKMEKASCSFPQAGSKIHSDLKVGQAFEFQLQDMTQM
jgi:hypothetical protein